MADEQSTKKGNWFKRHKILTAIGVIIIIAIVVSAGNGGSKTSNSNNASKSSGSSSSSKAQPTAKIGQPADDGKFEFTVSSFKCGETSITQPDNAYSTAHPQGQFCVMNLTVKNIGTVSQAFDNNSQYVYDASSKQFSYSSEGTIVANPSSSQFGLYQTINPGVSVSGIIVFDVPQGVTPTYAVLHDSSASNGVKVTLQ